MSFEVQKSTFLALLGATIVALGYFAIATSQILRHERIEQQHLIDITNAFTRAYAEERSSESVVPATFRRIGMDHFSAGVGQSTDTAAAAAIMRMPGVPGLELETVENDPRIRDYIQEFVDAEYPSKLEEFRIESNRLIARTLVPSVAYNPTCVACHNTALEANIFELGDVMGAFVVETDLTGVIRQNAMVAVGAFVFVLVGALSMARRERLRMQRVVDALTGRVEAETYASFLASHDALTGLANRTIFRERLDKEVERTNRTDHGDVLALILDVDDFKKVNDTMGHDVGDAVLKAIAERLKAVLDDHQGLAARLGGDEFAGLVAVPKNGMDAFDLGRRLIAALSAPLEHKPKRVQPRVSIGISRLRDLDDANSSHLLKAADEALYAAKRRGKLCFHVFDDDLRAQVGRRLELTASLPHAIHSGAVTAILQPQIDVRTNAVIGFEALARWTHRGKVISPAEFIPIAEDAGLIPKLDIAVLEQAAVLAHQLMARCNRCFRLSFNVSTVDLKSDDIVEDISDVLLTTGFDPRLLTVEITETAFLADWSSVSRRLNMLREMGIQIALDDFGTGYSSLSYLTQFSFDVIKVDRTFLHDLERDPQRAILLTHIIKLATSLDKVVIAEGIEHPDQAKRVGELGCTLAQGELYGLDIEHAPGLLDHPASDQRLIA